VEWSRGRAASAIRSGTGVPPVCFRQRQSRLQSETHGRDARATTPQQDGAAARSVLPKVICNWYYLGLCPSERTSGADRQQGGITKLGNGIARKAMIEAAWNQRTAPRISRTVLARQEGLPKAVTEIAWNAQTRLHQRYKHLTGVGRKKSQVAAAALGRELAGFIWAIGRLVKPRPAPAPSSVKQTAA